MLLKILLSLCMLVGIQGLGHPNNVPPGVLVEEVGKPPLPAAPQPHAGEAVMVEDDPNHYGRYGPGHGRRHECEDLDEQLCTWVVNKNKCGKRRYSKKCERSCGICKEEDCRDTNGFRCKYANQISCQQFYFYMGCMKTCGKCKTETTTTTPSTTTPESRECRDTGYNCYAANKYRCTRFWFANQCRKSCRLCTTTTKTTTEKTTTTTSTIPQTTSSVTTTSTIPETTATTVATTKSTEMVPSTTNSPTTEEITTAPVTNTSCVDQSDNCEAWGRLGFCYNKEFMKDMLELCPSTCQEC